MTYATLRNAITCDFVEVLSCDVFDTLLLRSLRPERSRLEEISRLQLNALAGAGYQCGLSPEDFKALRQTASNAAYRNARKIQGTRDGSYATILKLMCEMAELPSECVDVMKNVELRYEKASLRVNSQLISIVCAARNRGKKVIAISDMYFSQNEIHKLLERHNIAHLCDRIFASSDYGLTKNSGHLYHVVLDSLGIDSARMVHVGDNFVADVIRARDHGIRAIHLPRHTLFRSLTAGWKKCDK